jgi:branched-chain amino acid transport system substrate-binding protein
VAGTEHSTILGKIRFAGSENVGTPGTVSQWQKGEFEVVWPKSVATALLLQAGAEPRQAGVVT